MASVTGDTAGALLAHDKVDRFRPLGAFGRPAYQSHVQLRAMLLAKRGPKFANFFAKPTYNADAGELRWTAEIPGAARTWEELSPQEQAQQAPELEVVRSGLASYAQELRTQGGSESGGSQAFASLLEQAMKVPARGNFLYFVGDQPVIAFWGFETHSGESVDAAIRVPQYAAHALPPSATAPAVAAAVVPGAQSAAVATAMQRKRPWWWWLLWALLALLLLLLLLMLLRGCTNEAPLTGDVPRLKDAPLPDKAGVERDATRVDREGAPGDAASREGGPGGDVLGDARRGGPGELGGGVDAAPDGKPLPDELKGLPGDSKPLPGDTKGLPGDDSGKSGLPDHPPFGDRKADAAGKGGRPDDKGGPDALAGKGTTRPLDLPPEDKAGKGMDFLAGRWKAGEGLADRDTGQPLDLSFDFNKDGKGEVTVRRPDGSTCKGGVESAMRGGRLTIEGNQSIPCSGGGAYAAPKIECSRARSGETQCFGVNRDGSKYYMGIQRQP